MTALTGSPAAVPLVVAATTPVASPAAHTTTRDVPFDPQRLQRIAIRCSAVATAAVTAFACMMVLARLTLTARLPPELPLMNAKAALGLALAGISSWLVLRRRSERVARALALATAALGAAALIQRADGMDVGAVLCLLGAALVLRDVRSERGRHAAEASVVLAGLIALLGGGGHAFGIAPSPLLVAHASMQPQTGAAMLVLCVAVMLARPNRGIAGEMMSNSSGGFMARRLVPTIVVVPVLMGALTLLGVRLGVYDAAFGASIDLVVGIAIMTAAVLIATKRLNRIDDDRQRAAEKVIELNEHLLFRTGELEEVNRELEAFSYSVSHDLRSPIRHIGSFSDLLERRCAGRLDLQAQHYVKTIADAARRAAELIDDLLAFSRMSRAELRAMPVDTQDCVEQVWHQLAHERAERQVELVLEPLPDTVADPHMAKLVWQNLLGNALKYTRTRAKAVITVSARTELLENVYTVRDNGVGFDMQYADKLFGVFQRLHPQHEFEGSGIGLANVKRIVARHGGRVWAEGAVNQGASFSFSLPKPLKG